MKPDQPLSDKEVKELSKAFRLAATRIKAQIRAIDPEDSALTEAFLKARLAEIEKIMVSLKGDAAAWAEKNIPAYARTGAAEVLVSIGAFASVKEASAFLQLSTMRTELMKKRILIVKTDLLGGVDKAYANIQRSIRTVTQKVLTEQYGAGLMSTSAFRDSLVAEMTAEMNKIGEPYVISAKRKWRIEDYADMVARTHMMRTHHEHKIEQAREYGLQYAKISTHARTVDACKYHQGRVVKLSREAPGDYPYWEDLKEQIFHPRCRHRLLPIAAPDHLSDDDWTRAQAQHVIGSRAAEVKTASGRTATNPALLQQKVDTSVPKGALTPKPATPSPTDQLKEMLARNGVPAANIARMDQVEPVPSVSAFTPAKTVKEAEEWAAKQFNLTQSKMSGMGLDSVNAIHKTMFNLQKEFPEVFENQLWSLTTIDDFRSHLIENKIAWGGLDEDFSKIEAFAMPNTRLNKGGIFFNANNAGDFDETAKSRGDSAKSGFFVPTNLPGVEALTLHEFGHTIDFFFLRHGVDLREEFSNKWMAVIQKRVEEKQSRITLDTIEKDYFSEIEDVKVFLDNGTIDEEMYQTVLKSTVKRLRERAARETHKEFLSTYGMSNPAEMIAEAFSELYSSDNPREMAQDLGAVLKKHFDDLRQTNA